MALNLNRVLLAGNLTRDPEVRTTSGSKVVAKFTLAMNRKFKDANGELKDDATFVDVEAWGKTGELVGQYLKKGSGCFIEGRLKLDSWDDKETGAKRSKLTVVADNVQFTDSKVERQATTSATAATPDNSASGGASNDEPPFNICYMFGA